MMSELKAEEIELGVYLVGISCASNEVFRLLMIILACCALVKVMASRAKLRSEKRLQGIMSENTGDDRCSHNDRNQKRPTIRRKGWSERTGRGER